MMTIMIDDDDDGCGGVDGDDDNDDDDLDDDVQISMLMTFKWTVAVLTLAKQLFILQTVTLKGSYVYICVYAH